MAWHAAPCCITAPNRNIAHRVATRCTTIATQFDNAIVLERNTTRSSRVQPVATRTTHLQRSATCRNAAPLRLSRSGSASLPHLPRSPNSTAVSAPTTAPTCAHDRPHARARVGARAGAGARTVIVRPSRLEATGCVPLALVRPNTCTPHAHQQPAAPTLALCCSATSRAAPSNKRLNQSRTTAIYSRCIWMGALRGSRRSRRAGPVST
jgi:hypothetical protein